MHKILKKYGKVIEITEFEKTSQKIRVSSSYIRSDVHGARRLDSLRRSKQLCVRRVLSAIEEFGTPMFATLTFEGDASDAYYAKTALSRFQRRMHAKYPNTCSVLIPELSPRGRIHFHGLFFGLPLHWGDIYKRRGKSWELVFCGEERKNRTLATLWGEGFLDIRQTDGSPKLASYTAKYITKDGGETLFNGMRLLRFSRNFPKVLKITDSLIIEKVLESLEKQEPFNTWAGFTHFTGNISKRKYERSQL